VEFYTLILDNFVPQADVQKWRDIARFNEEEEIWETPEPDPQDILEQVMNLERPTASNKRRARSAIMPIIQMKPTPVMSSLKSADMSGVECEIEERFKDDESDFVIEIHGSNIFKSVGGVKL
jgi:hypothetical protein